MRALFPNILLVLACLCILALAAINSYNLREHKRDHKIHFQIKVISEKEKLEVELLREQLRKIREGTAGP